MLDLNTKTQKKAVRSINLDIRNTMTAFVGHSVGKSTIILARFYDPQEGKFN